MPAHKEFTKQDIIEAALTIVKKEGFEGLNARRLAKELHASTQPIYIEFKNMDEVKKEVRNEIERIYQSFAKKEMEKNIYPTFKSFGMGYILFAKKEPELFKILFLRKREDMNDNPDDLEPIYQLLMKSQGLTYEQAQKLHLTSWIFVHGLATQIVTQYIDWKEEELSSLLTLSFQGFLKEIKGESQHD